MWPWDCWEVSALAAPQPAAGSSFAYPVPGSQKQVIMCVTFVLTPAGAATRLVTLDLTGGDGQPLGRFSTGFTQTVAATTRYTFAVGISAYGANDAASIGCPIPPLLLEGKGGATVNVGSIQAGDVISGIRVVVAQEPIQYDDESAIS